jgi:KDO2-lipid IV(A) lauroyltransferase
MATAHFGSWEMLNLGARGRELPRATFIARPVRNERIDGHLRRQRERGGNRLVYRERALHACMGALRAGEIVASVIDMTILPAEGGLFADYFGTPALTSGALPLLAAARNSPLVFAVARPVAKGLRYRLSVEEIPVRAGMDRETEVPRLALELNRALERRVREQPEAWIWSYKRWKLRPGDLPGGYPSYALWVHPKW